MANVKDTAPITPIDGDPLTPSLSDVGGTVSDGAEMASSLSDVQGTLGEVAVEASEKDVGRVWKLGESIEDTYRVFGGASGGMGVVYFIDHTGWNTKLAVKTPHRTVIASETGKARYIREAESWVGLGMHPNLVSAFFVRTMDDIPRLFVEYVAGGTLGEWIKQRKLADFEPLLDVAIQLSDGMEYAHKRGLVHRDLKPDNIMMTPEGLVKVTDFGLVKVGDEEGVAKSAEDSLIGNALQTMAGARLGTPAFMAPEQWRDSAKADFTTDIYSFGVILYGLITHRMVFKPKGANRKERFQSLERQHSESPVPPLKGYRKDTPEELERFVLVCLEKKQKDRPESFEKVSERLRGLYGRITGREYGRSKPNEATLLAPALNNQGLSYLELAKDSDLSDEQSNEFHRKAEDKFHEALKADPHHLDSTYNLGLHQWRTAKITEDDLVRRLEEVRTTHESDWRDEYLLGLVHMERRDGKEAVRLLEEALKESSGAPEVAAALESARKMNQSSARIFTEFTGPVTSVCLSANGRRAMSRSNDNSLRVWEVPSGESVLVSSTAGAVDSVFLNGDGRRFLSGSKLSVLSLRDTETGKAIQDFGGAVRKGGRIEPVTCGCLSADGNSVLLGSRDSTLALRKVGKKKPHRIFKGHKDEVTSVSLSADGSLALSGSKDMTVRFWKSSIGRGPTAFSEHTDVVNSVCLSSDGQRALSGGRDRTLRLWDTAKKGRCLRVFEGHEASVNSVFLSADGKWAVSGSDDRTVRLWNATTGNCFRVFEDHSRSVTSVCLSADGRWALSGSADKTVRLWDVFSAQTEDSMVSPNAFSKAINLDEAVRNQDRFRGLIEEARREMKGARWKRALETTLEAKEIPGRERDQEVGDLLGELKRKTRCVGFQSGWHRRVLEGHDGKVTSISLSADGGKTLSGGEGKDVRLWEVETGECVRDFQKHKNGASSVFLRPDGQWAVSGSGETIQVWTTKTGTQLPPFEGHSGSVLASCVSSDGRWILSGGTDETVRLWDFETGKSVRTFSGHSGEVTSVCLSADHRYALSGSNDTTVRLWEVRTGKCVRVFDDHTGLVKSVCLGADGGQALSGSLDGTVRLWDIPTGECVRTFEEHDGPVHSVCLSMDGRWAVSGSDDKTVRLWETETGDCARTFGGHASSVDSVAMSEDGRLVLSGSTDETIRVWELDWDLEAVEDAEWDERVIPYLETFLTLHTPYVGEISVKGEPTEEEITDALTRQGKPTWTDEDFERLLHTLGCANYGWLRPEEVERELKKRASKWFEPTRIEKPALHEHKIRSLKNAAIEAKIPDYNAKKLEEEANGVASAFRSKLKPYTDKLSRWVLIKTPVLHPHRYRGAIVLGIVLFAGGYYFLSQRYLSPPVSEDGAATAPDPVMSAARTESLTITNLVGTWTTKEGLWRFSEDGRFTINETEPATYRHGFYELGPGKLALTWAIVGGETRSVITDPYLVGDQLWGTKRGKELQLMTRFGVSRYRSRSRTDWKQTSEPARASTARKPTPRPMPKSEVSSDSITGQDLVGTWVSEEEGTETQTITRSNSSSGGLSFSRSGSTGSGFGATGSRYRSTSSRTNTSRNRWTQVATTPSLSGQKSRSMEVPKTIRNTWVFTDSGHFSVSASATARHGTYEVRGGMLVLTWTLVGGETSTVIRDPHLINNELWGTKEGKKTKLMVRSTPSSSRSTSSGRSRSRY